MSWPDPACLHPVVAEAWTLYEDPPRLVALLCTTCLASLPRYPCPPGEHGARTEVRTLAGTVAAAWCEDCHYPLPLLEPEGVNHATH